jgi:histone acetyltransferase (RNA polymerase elongator complex component)
MENKFVIIPIFIPHKGCPFDCIYCNQKTISGQTEEMSSEKMISIIDEHLTTIQKENTTVEIAFYGGSFTGIDKNMQIDFLKAADGYVKNGLVKGIRLSTRPDYINEEILEYLKYCNVKTIELGVQSLDKEVLAKSCRGHSVEDVSRASELIKRSGITLGIQTMIGLPGDTRDKALSTAKMVIDLKPQIIRIYPTLVIRNTYLEKLYQDGKYIPLNLEQAVDLSTELMELYEAQGLNVIRVGLQPSENINNDMDVVAGPFHPAFRQLVESRLMLKKMTEEILLKGLDRVDNITIYVNTRHVSDVVGQKRLNIETLKEKFNFKRIKVVSVEQNDKKLFDITKY